MQASFFPRLLTVVLVCAGGGGVEAAQLSMRFSDGGGRVSLAPLETAIIEVVWRMEAGGKTARNLAGLSNRFNVQGPATIEVVSTATSLSGWSTDVSGQVGDALCSFFASANADSIVGNFITETDVAFETVIQEIEIRNVDGTSGSVEISFRLEEPLPDAFTSSAATWTLVAADPAVMQYDIGRGSPGYEGIGGTNAADPLVVDLVSGDGQGGGGTDTDNDGLPDDQDTFPDDPDETTDTDEDGIGDNADTDDDNDGVGDDADVFPDDPDETTDTDDDGVGDNTDTDDDDDGVADVVDLDPLDPTVGQDGGDSSGGGGVARGPCGLGIITAMPLFATGVLGLRLERRRRRRA